MAKHRHQWLPGMPGFETCVSCGARRPTLETAVKSKRGLPQDRQPPKSDPLGSLLSGGLSINGLYKAMRKEEDIREEEAERLRQVQEQVRQIQEREEQIRTLLSRSVLPVAEIQKVAEAMGKFSTTTEAASESFRNSWIAEGNPEQVKMREPTPEEALQVIFDYLEFVADEKGVDDLRTVAGMWMSKVTNGISDIVRKHEDKEGG